MVDKDIYVLNMLSSKNKDIIITIIIGEFSVLLGQVPFGFDLEQINF